MLCQSYVSLPSYDYLNGAVGLGFLGEQLTIRVRVWPMVLSLGRLGLFVVVLWSLRQFDFTVTHLRIFDCVVKADC